MYVILYLQYFLSFSDILVKTVAYVKNQQHQNMVLLDDFDIHEPKGIS